MNHKLVAEIKFMVRIQPVKSSTHKHIHIVFS